LLLPLIEEFGDRVEVWLFRSPKLRGIMEKIVPERFDEGWGTWHGKWYGVDDEVILSGWVKPRWLELTSGRIWQRRISRTGKTGTSTSNPIRRCFPTSPR
jgi:hypothetical protein